MYTPIRSSDIREHNEKLVLRMILMAGAEGIAQSDIVTKTGLKAPTVFRIFNNLERLNYIEMSGKPEELPETVKKKGRKPVLYQIRPNTFFTIGVDFWENHLYAGLFDLTGEQKQVLTQNFTTHTVEHVLETIIASIKKLIADAGIASEQVLGVGIGAPGQVDLESRSIMHYPGITGINNFPLCEHIEAACSIPAFIHNNCAVLGMQAAEQYPIQESLFLMIVRRGINGVFIQNRTPFVFKNNKTIEFGHIPIFSNTERCSCGAQGCLEAVISKLDNHSGNDWLFEPYYADITALKENTKLFNELIDVFASAVQSIRRLFDPHLFLLMTGNKEFSELLCNAVQKKLEGCTSIFDDGDFALQATVYNPEHALLGAAKLVIEHLLS
ncbi:MAG TPA: ROK family protein [Spirochaetia bacterium]|nr:ROK family protein [Spirochaetales bacterium]HRS64973.1 ROK family protein [Spirochaetia bacterium]HPD81093.1 ROK family protein [Spirochaetales bacterium]HQG39617.1 ROK family protein [Spirochaetales bacterium]HQK35033.1 ROK family protein [Spirochaetales bacterium]